MDYKFDDVIVIICNNIAGKRIGVYLRVYIFGSSSAHLCWSGLRCCQTSKQTKKTLENETRRKEIRKQVERHNDGKNVRERMVARQSQAFGKGKVRASSPNAHSGPKRGEVEIGQLFQLRHDNRRRITGTMLPVFGVHRANNNC